MPVEILISSFIKIYWMFINLSWRLDYWSYMFFTTWYIQNSLVDDSVNSIDFNWVCGL